ncbi:hypothetical protein HZY62_09785 [Maribacter polysiphoniae]|uniref:Collagen triple helix repeat protein n=1 Tax=Maribacter polysiphoniae TaxID=429344 RepID=A0A316E1V3_9FLAO|nr:hypothetical protein [Maribacter polysiphoniae]MBD1260876.1 hypothetical protein [Maribacter polysiphoniae]PWK23986.1 hypothetical protein LX92_01572 [Maribacter polysiphoniae]
MKTTMKLLSYGLTIFTILCSSCSKDGDTGPIGPAGTAGIDGIDGEDGNANVRTFVFNDVGFSGAETIALDMTGILTPEVIKRDVILVYLRVGDESLASRGRVFNLPSRVLGSFSDDIPTQYINFWLDDSENGIPEKIIVNTRSIENTTLFPDERTPVEWIKVVIIESSFSELSSKSQSSTISVMAELKSAGVDVNDYQSVCAYYGICGD